MIDPSTPSSPATPAAVTYPLGERRIGIVFVHGIGEQKQSSTIRQQGGPLLDWIWGWHNARGFQADQSLQPQWAKLSYGATLAGPARFLVRIPAYDSTTPEPRHWPAATWVFAEGWWASRLEAPSMTTMLAWSLGILGRFWAGLFDEAVGRTAERYGHRPSRGAWSPSRLARIGARLGEWVERIGNFLLMLAYLPIALLSYPFVALLLLVAQIPIDALQKFILLTLIRPLLVDRVGDFWIYLHDYPGAMHIRRGVEEAIDALVDTDQCNEIVVVAHSQGAVVAYDALSSGGIKHIDLVRRFITMGGALNKAWSLEEGIKGLNAALPASLERWVDLWANYDPVPSGPLVRRFDILKSERLTNGINVLTDHDSYWRNPEEFLSRLAQEIDAPQSHRPTDPPFSSRFWPGTDRQAVLVGRRANRVHALVLWRCAAVLLFFAAVYRRVNDADPSESLRGLGRLVRDGRGMWAAAKALPGFDIVLKPVEAVGSWIDGVLGNFGPTLDGPLRDLWVWFSALPGAAVLLGPLTTFGSWIDQALPGARIDHFEQFGMIGVALVGFALFLGIGYLLVGLVVYRAWDKRESDDVGRPLVLGARRAGADLVWRIPLGVVVVGLVAAAIGWS